MQKNQIIDLKSFSLAFVAALAFGVYYFYFRPKLAEQRDGVQRTANRPTYRRRSDAPPADEKLKQY